MYAFYNQTKASNATHFLQLAPFQFEGTSQKIIFPSLSKFKVSIGYGTLNALSGDHAENPLALEEQLLTLNSTLLKIISLQNEYIGKGYSSAPNGTLNDIDGNYAFLALKNFSHFYVYGNGFQKHIADFKLVNIENSINPSLIGAVFKELNSTNAINMYVTLHTTAIYLAELAGIKSKLDDAEAKKFLYYAFLYNAFADHFLEDAFSSGHLLVNRTLVQSVIDNKSVHDFYCQYGTNVLNIKGEKWTAFGDNYYNQFHNAYLNKNQLGDISYPDLTTEAQRIVDAVQISITEVHDAFERGYSESTALIHIIKQIPALKSEKTRFFLSHFKVLNLIPIPYNSNLNLIMPDSIADKKENKIANQLPYLRNFVRNRVANSFLLGVNTNFLINTITTYQGLNIRLNLGLIYSIYVVNSSKTKKGVVDSWHGYTVSYAFGNIHNTENNTVSYDWILKGGIRSNFDFWVTDKRFIGLFAYNEVGLERRSLNSSLVYVPQIGVQLGSLFDFNYYNLPTFLRIPAQIILPLKFKMGVVISTNSQPAYYTGTEIDVFF